MTFNISAWAIRRPVPALVFFIVMLVLGLAAFRSLPTALTPNIDVPVVSVSVTQPGAAPAELETQVTKKIEDAVVNVPGVKHVASTVTDGSLMTMIEFRLEVGTDRAVNDVKEAIARIRADLPRTVDEPIVERLDVASLPLRTYAASAPGMTLEQLSWYVDDVVRRELQGLKGVGRIERIGGVQREIQVRLDPDRMMSLGITAADVSRQLRATTADFASGRGEIGGQEQSIRTLASTSTVRGLAGTRIALPGGRNVRLADLGEVDDHYEEPRSFARLNGSQQVVSFLVYRAKGASDVEVGDLVAEKLRQLSEANPNVTYTLIDDTISYIAKTYRSTMTTMIEGAVLAILVVALFLRDWRATLIAAAAIPLSIIPTFWVMSVMGFSLNPVSLLGITLVTGILVDDAIVEIENIVRHMRQGKSPYRAAVEAAEEIGLTVIAITLTIVAVFAPISFMGGVPGQYLKQFGLTVTVAALFSLLVARFLTPMMAAYFMTPQPAGKERDGPLIRRYMKFLHISVKHRYLTLAAGLVFFALSIWSVTLLPATFVPTEDISRTVISIELAPGSTLDATRGATDRIATVLRKVPEVRSVITLGGMTPSGQISEVRKATLNVVLLPKIKRERSQKEIELSISTYLTEVPDIRFWYVNPRGEREFTVALMSKDSHALDKVVTALDAAMRRQHGFSNVAADTGLNRPEVQILPRLDEAARLGISTEAISDTVRVATIGDTGTALAKFNTGDRQIPIRVQLRTAAKQDIRVLKTLTVAGTSGTVVPLSEVANVMFGQGPSSIERFDRMRRVVIGADLAGDITLGQAYDQVKSLPEARNLPAGVRIQESGDVETMTEAFSSFTNAMGAGLLMVLAILVVLFGNISQPITILLSLPFSIGGAILALLLTNNPFSLPVIIGILMLMGIVAKNAIMLVDFAAEEERRGVPRLMAIIDAGRKRARPIIMTTVAMVAGMLPSTLGTGDGGEFQAPMAITVVGGLIVSTAMSLIFVPSLYVVIKGTSECIAQGLRHFVHSPDRLMPAGKPVKAIAPPGNDGQAATLTEPVN